MIFKIKFNACYKKWIGYLYINKNQYNFYKRCFNIPINEIPTIECAKELYFIRTIFTERMFKKIENALYDGVVLIKILNINGKEVNYGDN